MIRVKDIANMVGVSPTTVSNVIHGNTKRVSQETAQKISSILDEVGYIPNMGARLLSQNTSHIIGLVIGFDYLHGENAMQDPFVSTFVGQISSEIENAGYYMMIIRGDDCRKVAEVASRWNVDGLIVLGWTEKSHKTLKKMLKKPTVAIDTYVSLSAWKVLGRSWIQENTVSDRKYCRDGSVSICRISKSDDRGIWSVQKGRKINLTFVEKRSTQITI